MSTSSIHLEYCASIILQVRRHPSPLGRLELSCTNVAANSCRAPDDVTAGEEGQLPELVVDMIYIYIYYIYAANMGMENPPLFRQKAREL